MIEAKQHLFYTLDYNMFCIQIKYNLYWKWSWNWNIFINVSRVKEVTIAPINKSSWINWIKILQIFFCCIIIRCLYHSCLTFYFIPFFSFIENQKNSRRKKMWYSFVLLLTRQHTRNFQISIFSRSFYDLWLFWVLFFFYGD